MKVECIKIPDPDTGESLDNNSWLTVGKVYQVLSVFIADNSSPEYRLISDDGRAPGMYKADQFKLVSEVLPSNWTAHRDAGEYFELAPKSWLKAGFCEEYFDGMPEAVELFNVEKERILKENS